MKRKILPALFLISTTFALITSCGPSSNPTTSENEQVTGVEIGGAGTVKVGGTIKLIASVTGSSNQNVTWSSENESVATVDSNGNVTGISEGKVNIVAVSAADPNYFGKKEILVTRTKAENLSIVVEESEHVSIGENGVYDVQLGAPIKVEVVTNPSDGAIPELLLFEVITTGDVPASQFVITQEETNSPRATFVGYSAANAVTLKVKGNYSDLTSAPLISSITLNVIDGQSENREAFTSKLSAYKQKEIDNLGSGTFSYTYKEDGEKVSAGRISFYNAKEETMTAISTETETGYESHYIHNSIYHNYYKNIDQYYTFSYDKNFEVIDLYNNERATAGETRNQLFAYESGETVKYGLSTRLLDLIEDSQNPIGQIISFGNLYASSSAIFDVEASTNTVKSEFIDPNTGDRNKLSLSIQYDDKDQIQEYEFSVEITTVEGNSYSYIEKSEGLIYDVKPETVSNLYHVSADYFFLQDYSLTTCHEKTDYYDYSDDTKYGPEKTEDIDGITKYVLPKDKTLVLKVNPSSTDSTESTLIDRVEATSENPTVIPSPTLNGSDIFVINPYKDAHDNIVLGESKITFNSEKGITKSIIVEFIDTVLEKVFTTNIPENNDFGEIFRGNETSYFFINTEPDEDIYTYKLNILEGDEDGLELFRYEYDNPFNYPGFSYAVRGLKNGTYKFKIVVEGTSVETEDIYSVTVVEPYSVAYLKEQLVDSNSKFVYTTGTFKAFISFKSETEIEIESHILGMDPTKATINYKFEPGKIVLEDYQTFPKNMYFEHVKKGQVFFTDNFEELTIFMSLYNGTASTEITDETYFTPITFKKFVDKSDIPSYIPGKTFTSDVFIIGKGELKTELSFTKTSGVFTLYDKDGEVMFKSSFDYIYDVPATALILTNVTVDVKYGAYFIKEEIYYNSGYDRLEVKLYENSYDYNYSYFSI